MGLSRIAGNTWGSSRHSTAWHRALVERTLAADWQTATAEISEAVPAISAHITRERIGDWRFLLPEAPRGRVLCLGGALSVVPLALARTAALVVVADRIGDVAFLEARARQKNVCNIETLVLAPGMPINAQGTFDLVAALRPAPDLPQPFWRNLPLSALTDYVSARGHLYLEHDFPALLRSPKRWRQHLAQLGFGRVECYWPKPTLRDSELLLPLGDRQLQHYYLDEIFFAMSGRRRALRLVLRMLVVANLFELTLPGYVLLARRDAPLPR